LRHRRIVETAGEGVWQVDQQGITTLANEAMARMLGTTVALLHGRPLFDFMDEEGQRLAAQLLLGRRGGGSERHELRFRRADGRELWAEVASCPITGADGQHTGVLAMVTDATERRHRDEELRASNTRLRSMVADLERHKQDMAQIAELNELLQSARTETEAFDVIRAVGERLFAGSSGGLSIAGSGDEMIRVAAWGSPPGCRRATSGRPAGPSGAAARTCRHRGMACTAATTPATAPCRLLCTPLSVEGRLLGLLHLGDGAGTGDALLDDATRRRVELFGEVIKLGLSNLRLRDSLRDQALHDALTGLPNRRLFDETLPRELARCVRSGQALTVAIIDVDHFKRFNDHYGHDMGDRVLRAVAATLLRGIRSGDLACRYGGDEFLCLLVGTTAAEAQARFVELLAQAPVADDPGNGVLPEPVTFTIGLASAPESGTLAADLLRAADAALYAAKARGGHRVELAVRQPSGTAGAQPTHLQPG
jgi:diguanylate cyclase (GGDEF)-like protein/PAS domain S-box-containing protein